MFAPLLSLVIALASGAPGADSVSAAAWTPVVACDEVRVDVERTARRDAEVASRGEPMRVRLRWALFSRDVSPAAWYQGVRTTVDVLEIDCASASSRTLTSRAFAADGSAVSAASIATTAAPWRRHTAGSVGALVVGAVCSAAGQAEPGA